MLCVSLFEAEFDALKQALSAVECAEIRLDAAAFTRDQIREIFSQKGKQLIATHRPTDISDEERADSLCVAIAAGAAYVDIEIESLPAFRETVLGFARGHECRVIVSYHNYETTPGEAELTAIVNECRQKGADVVKLACMTHSTADAARMLALYKFDNILAIAMGDYGRVTRVAAPFLGAPFTFVSLSADKATAPGQISLDAMRTILDRMQK